MAEVLKIYEFGDPTLLKSYDYNDYLLALIVTGDKLLTFWRQNVKRYFNRTKPNYFSKSGEFKLQMPKKSSSRSSLITALGAPDIHVGTKFGLLPLYNIVKSSPNGSQVELIKLLMTGAGEKSGMHFDGTGMRPGGTWKGFPPTYWIRWDGVFTEQCISESANMRDYLNTLKGRATYQVGDSDYDNPEDLVNAYRMGNAAGIGGIV